MIRALWLIPALLLVACDSPPVEPSADLQQQTQTSRIDGEVVVQGSARGNAVVLLYDAAHPPPPVGTGHPVSFAVVPGSTLFSGASAGAGGPFVAPFHFSLVHAGSYLLEGFIDQDGCASAASDCVGPDFNPFFTVTREPNAGDVGGAALATDGQPAAFTIAKGAGGTLNAIGGVSVGYADSARFPADRPVFSVTGSGELDPNAGPIALELNATPIDVSPVHERAPVFFAKYAAFDSNGQPVDADGDGVPDFYPKVLVRKLADQGPPLADENDLDQNGKPRTDAVPLTSLTVFVKPLALDISDPNKPAPLQSVPPGRYAITIENFTGQTWRTPNELDPTLAAAFQMPAVESQSFVITVP